MEPTLSRAAASAALPGWRRLATQMHLSVPTGDFATGLALVQRIGALAEEHNHHPDLDLRWGRVHVAMSSHDAGGITDRDVRLGLAVSALLDEMGLHPEASALTQVEVGIDAMDIPTVLPFWAAVLDRRERDGGLPPTDGIGPVVWFQQMSSPRSQRNRIHLDVTVAHDEAPERLRRALAAGGRLVSDKKAPAFWVLADPEGNEACLCTWQSRD